MKKLLIINAVIWAAVILLCSYWFSDTENYSYLFGTLIVAAGLQHSLTYDFIRKQGKKKV